MPLVYTASSLIVPGAVGLHFIHRNRLLPSDLPTDFRVTFFRIGTAFALPLWKIQKTVLTDLLKAGLLRGLLLM